MKSNIHLSEALKDQVGAFELEAGICQTKIAQIIGFREEFNEIKLKLVRSIEKMELLKCM